MIECPVCSAEHPDTARFCSACGSALTRETLSPRTSHDARLDSSSTAPLATDERTERRVVTTLCCDLVGFTSRCERDDPEDVDRLLRDYCALARHVIEAHGGAVEKFIGDAVFGVFGVPVVHEDDPERAVRAALRIVARLSEVDAGGEPLQVRVGVNTGESLVRLDVDPASGEGMLVGDAVNTTARLQGSAPPQGVLVGDLTRSLTEHAVEYRDLSSIRLKGKAEMVRAWLAVRPKARVGVDLFGPSSAAFQGRTGELLSLTRAFDACVETASPHFRLLAGEAGIGKSRLVLEFARALERDPRRLVTWRQGRCLPYSEGATFAPLGEIVRMHAGIQDGDTASEMEKKLADAVQQDDARAWLREHLAPLAGLPAGDAALSEHFAAWAAFFLGIASREPTVVTIEDVHWADEGTIAFLRHLREQCREAPLFVLATARPEALGGGEAAWHADWQVDVLHSLSAASTATLIGDLADVSDVSPPDAELLFERCGGNPLYAEQLVRLLQANDGLSVSGSGSLVLDPEAASDLPESLRALVAARLDVLPHAQKDLLASAAVVGQVFWPGAVAAVHGGDGPTIERQFDQLAQREYVRRAQAPSVVGEKEYTFWHTITRDVAYSQLPRSRRAREHAGVGAWLAARPGSRATSEQQAYHYETALTLAKATRDQSLERAVREPAIAALESAGGLTASLDADKCEQYLARAVALSDVVREDHARLLGAWGRALRLCARPREAARQLTTAVDLAKTAGDRRTAARLMTELVDTDVLLGGDEWPSRIAEAEALIAEEGPCEEALLVLESVVWLRMCRFETAEALAVADRAVRMSDELGLPTPPALVGWRGMMRCDLGEVDGLQDLRRGIDLAIEQGQSSLAAMSLDNLAEATFIFRGARAALELRRRALDLARSHRQTGLAYRSEVEVISDLLWTGEWAEGLERAAPVRERIATHESVYSLAIIDAVTAHVLALMGRCEEAEPLVRWLESQKAEGVNFEDQIYVGVAGAALAQVQGRSAEAAGHVARAAALPDGVRGSLLYSLQIAESARIALSAGQRGLVGEITRGVRGQRPLDAAGLLAAAALEAELDGGYEAAAGLFTQTASHWRRLCIPYEEGQALLGAARCHEARGERALATKQATAAAAIFRRLGAAPALAETDGLLSTISPSRGAPD